ncbi:MAG: hypothetical protein SA339_06435 [Methanomassiliicoccus sp.]|nr:hypothetical protein [Methanomassiliicoccus sp.]
MKLEIHTFDPELINALMGKQPVLEGEVLELGSDACLIYVRTFSGRVKHFPYILHFEVVLLSEVGASSVSAWLFQHVGSRNVERVLVDYQDTKLDMGRMIGLLCQR